MGNIVLVFLSVIFVPAFFFHHNPTIMILGCTTSVLTIIILTSYFTILGHIWQVVGVAQWSAHSSQNSLMPGIFQTHKPGASTPDDVQPFVTLSYFS